MNRSQLILDTRKIFKEQSILQQNVPAYSYICLMLKGYEIWVFHS